jgi:hypothetical protein
MKRVKKGGAGHVAGTSKRKMLYNILLRNDVEKRLHERPRLR